MAEQKFERGTSLSIFVSDRREGKKAFYSLRPELSARILALIRSAVEAVTDIEVMAEDRDSLDRILQKRRRVSESRPCRQRLYGRFAPHPLRPPG